MTGGAAAEKPPDSGDGRHAVNKDAFLLLLPPQPGRVLRFLVFLCWGVVAPRGQQRWAGLQVKEEPRCLRLHLPLLLLTLPLY